jgi:hypothetical protein
MNVLVIPEDFRKDQLILKPIVQAMMRALNRASAKVDICRDPLLGGVTEALKWENITAVLDRHKGMVDLFLLCVDRDGLEGRRTALNSLELKAAAVLPAGRFFLAENAWQEIEVWVLAGHEDLPQQWNWRDIRAETNPKEKYFAVYAINRGVSENHDGGRKVLAEEAAARYGRIRQLCPEDVAALEKRIEAVLRH